MHTADSQVTTLSEKVEKITSQKPLLCYQCGKCSAGCPIREFMDDAPNQVVRYVQLDFDKVALNSSTIWLCAGCLTCTTRCPQNFDLAKFMDALREIALREGIDTGKNDIVKFHRAFLNQIKNHGRAYELGLIRDYKLKTFHLLQDIDVAPEMLFKGKIGLLPHKVKDVKSIKKIFNNIDQW